MAKQSDQKALAAILPPPPIFKPTFIQMQKMNSSKSPRDLPEATTNPSPTITTLNSNYLTSSFVPNEEYNNRLISTSPSISPMTYYTDPQSGAVPLSSNQGSPQPRKRRRTSHISSREESDRKKRELKAQHSIIEKKRRIKMNREFEALKFLVPACRRSILSGLNENSFENSNMMHKLTILQSTVEYIKYLHLVIRLMKLKMLTPKKSREYFRGWFLKNGDLKFAEFDLDLQKCRNIDQEFSFEDLFTEVWQNEGEVPHKNRDLVSKEIEMLLGEVGQSEEEEEEDIESGNSSDSDLSSFRLPLPAITDTRKFTGSLSNSFSRPELRKSSVSFSPHLRSLPLPTQSPVLLHGSGPGSRVSHTPERESPQATSTSTAELIVASQLVSIKGRERRSSSIQSLLN